MKKRILMLLVLGMLVVSGCAACPPAYLVCISTGAMVTFDKDVYKILKNYDWFMINTEQYMPEYTEYKGGVWCMDPNVPTEKINHLKRLKG